MINSSALEIANSLTARQADLIAETAIREMQDVYAREMRHIQTKHDKRELLSNLNGKIKQIYFLCDLLFACGKNTRDAAMKVAAECQAMDARIAQETIKNSCELLREPSA